MVTPVDEPLTLRQQPLRHLPEGAVGGGHHDHPVTCVGGQAHDATSGEDLVVRVGVEAHKNSRGVPRAAATVPCCHACSYLVVAVRRSSWRSGVEDSRFSWRSIQRLLMAARPGETVSRNRPRRQNARWVNAAPWVASTRCCTGRR